MTRKEHDQLGKILQQQGMVMLMLRQLYQQVGDELQAEDRANTLLDQPEGAPNDQRSI